MKCKFCSAELAEDMKFCHQCGKAQDEPAEEMPAAEELVEEITEAAEPVKEKKKMSKGGKIALAVTGLVLLAILLAGAVLHFMGKLDDVHRFIGIGVKNDIYRKSNYTAKNEKVEKNTELVIATLGDQKLTNGELQAHYWMSVYDFVNQYGSYASYIGLDLSKPFDEQVYDEATGMTYQQYFLEKALQSWQRYAVLAQMADDAGFQYSAEQQKRLDDIPAMLQSLATEGGYTDMEAFIDKEFYPGCSMASYMSYSSVSWKAMCYFDKMYDDLMPTDEEIDAYYAAHEAEFVQNKKAKENGDYYDVRHILVAIEGEPTTDENLKTVYLQEHWDNCLAKAQKMLDDFLANDPTEEKFAELASKNSADPGSASNGGLYEKLTKDYGFIENFENWYTDESRKEGDTGIVQNTESSTQGYHIMYFCGKQPIWKYETRSAILSERTEELLKEAESKWPLEIEYKKIKLGQVELTSQ